MTTRIVTGRPTITRKEMEGVLDCLINDELETGGTVKNFEQLASEALGAKYSLAVSSLTAAYHLALAALDAPREKEVIVPAFFNQAPCNAAAMLGLTVIPVDTVEGTVFPSPEAIQSAITGNTVAVIIGDTFGYGIDLDQFTGLPVPVIHDISHSFGMEKDHETPAAFTVASFSTSMILTTGHGAVVQTGNSRHFSRMRDLRSNNDAINFDYTMTDLQGAMGISQFHRLKEFLRRRSEIAKRYTDALSSTPHQPLTPFNERFAYQSFPVLFDSTAERVEKFWKKNAVEVELLLPKPVHALLGLRGLDFPNSDRMARKLFGVPIYPTLTKKEIERVSKLLSSFM